MVEEAVVLPRTQEVEEAVEEVENPFVQKSFPLSIKVSS
jgi:hypothetical protein